MLTRLEVDGFKNLVGVQVEFGPFTCVAGANGVGKSNLFDAIRFLSLLAEHKLVRAAQLVRGTDEDPTDPRELFGRAVEPAPMWLAAEMIVPGSVRDSFGRTASASTTFLRYELELRYVAPTGGERFGRVELQHERLVHITQSDAPAHLRWPHARTFRAAVVTGARRGGPFVSTTTDDGVVSVNRHQDGGSRGKPQPSRARDMTATTLAATVNVDDPTLFAAKTEMLGWRLLALEPRAMRRPDRFWVTPEARSVEADGGHLPVALWRLGSDDAARTEAFARVASRLSALVPVRAIRVTANDANQQFELEVQERKGGPWLGARALSEGTLRFLALATLAEASRGVRLLCMEEPENGIHPSRIEAVLGLLREIAVDPFEPPGPEALVQVIVNTHAPRVVNALEGGGAKADLLIAEPASERVGDEIVRTVRFRHRIGTWRATPEDPGVGAGVVQAYLGVPGGAQLSLAGEHE